MKISLNSASFFLKKNLKKLPPLVFTVNYAREAYKKFFMKKNGEKRLREIYYSQHGVLLDINNTTTFSEKLFRRMILNIRNGNNTQTTLSDKLKVRNYVQNKIGENFLTQLYWYGSNPELLPFDILPEKCMIKTSHDSGGNTIYDKNIENREECITRMKDSIKKNHYWVGYEYQYFDIKPMVLVEEYLDDGYSDGPLNYRFWCFSGSVEVIQVDNSTENINPFYDTEWRKIGLHYRDEFNEFDIDKPKNIKEMIRIAEALASDFDFVRVDLYNIRDRIVFGELTFTPRGGKMLLKPDDWNHRLGKKWTISI